MDPVTLVEQAGERTAKIVEGISPDQLGAPTPCTDWDVRGVLNHLVGENWMFATLLAGQPLPDMADGADLVGDDPAGAYRASFDAAIAAWREPGALERTIDLPMGPAPAAFAISLHFADLLVHGWDVAKGTGQDTDLDPDLANAAFAIMSGVFAHAPMPETVFKKSVPVGDDASPGEKLVALLGRNP